jgi:hypothetical protein
MDKGHFSTGGVLEDHEFKAFLEFLVNFKYDFDFLGRVDAESYAFRLRKE